MNRFLIVCVLGLLVAPLVGCDYYNRWFGASQANATSQPAAADLETVTIPTYAAKGTAEFTVRETLSRTRAARNTLLSEIRTAEAIIEKLPKEYDRPKDTISALSKLRKALEEVERLEQTTADASPPGPTMKWGSDEHAEAIASRVLHNTALALQKRAEQR